VAELLSNYNSNDFVATKKWKFNCSWQGCGLRKISRFPKVPNHEILGAIYMKRVSVSSHPKGKVIRQCTWVLLEHSLGLVGFVCNAEYWIDANHNSQIFIRL